MTGIAFIGFLLLLVAFVVHVSRSQMPDPARSKGQAWILGVIGVLMIFVGSIAGAFTQVPAGYRAVLMRFGAVQGMLGEGIHFIVPGVNSVELVEVRTQKEESTATAASRDLQTVSTSLALNFRVDPAKVGELYQKVGTQYKSRIIDPAVQESVKVVTSRYSAEDLIRNRAQVKMEVEAEITKRLGAYNLIVEPSGLSITNFDFSPEFNKAIEAKQVAQQQSEQQKYVLAQAQLEQQTDIARAKGKAEAAKLNAEALRAQGGSLVIAREWITKWDGKLPQVGGGNNGYMIDIKSLMDSASEGRPGR